MSCDGVDASTLEDYSTFCGADNVDPQTGVLYYWVR